MVKKLWNVTVYRYAIGWRVVWSRDGMEPHHYTTKRENLINKLCSIQHKRGGRVFVYSDGWSWHVP